MQPGCLGCSYCAVLLNLTVANCVVRSGAVCVCVCARV